MKHTPGPLSIFPSSNPGNGTGWRDIVTTSGQYAPAYVGEAIEENARLFAATPDLLSALESCCDAIQRLAKESPDGVPIWASEAHGAARLAIAKATN